MRRHQLEPSGQQVMSTSSKTLQKYTLSGKEFVCGWGASSVNVIVTFPINKVQFRQQLYGITTRAATHQLQKEGLVALYRGLLPPFLQKSANLSIMFGMYDKYSKLFERRLPHVPVDINRAAAAMLSGSTEAILTPFERIQTVLQDRAYMNKFPNSVAVFSALREFGVSEYYRGLVPILVRNGFSNVMFFLTRKRLKDLFPETDSGVLNTLEDFASGGILGATISTIFYPVNVCKTRMQSQIGGEFQSLRTVFWQLYRERNSSLRSLCRGADINVVRCLLSWGIINATYELLRKWLYPEVMHPPTL